MLTRCPSCQTLFRVTPEQLRAQSGRVRCGQCRHAFNAIDTLLEESATHPPHPPPVEPLAQLQTMEQVPEPVRSDAADKVTETPGSPDTPNVPDIQDAITTSPARPSWKTFWKTSPEPASTPGPKIEPETGAEPEPALPQAPPAAEAGESPAPTFWPEPESATPTASAPVIEIPEPAAAPETGPETEPAAESETEPETEPAPGAEAAHPASFFILAPPPPHRWPWRVGSLLALLTLAIQVTIAFRVELATRLPDTRPALIALCDLAGCEVGLPARADLIGIEASDLHPDPQHAEQLEVSVTLKNRAAFAQTWPHLELTLTDIADKAIARKVLAPAEYLPAPASKTALATGMPPNDEAAVSFIIATDGLAASGYRLYLFYP